MTGPLQTVTCSFPILVDWSSEDPVTDPNELNELHAGHPTFPSDSLFVREVRREDIEAWLKRRASKGGRTRISHAGELKRALDRKDSSVIRGVLEKMRHAVPDYFEIHNRTLEIDTKERTATLKDRGINWGATAIANYGHLIAEKFKNVCLVMWYSERAARYFPALHCPDWETAVLVFALVGGYRGVQVCAYRKCNEVFSPNKAGQLCCCAKHTNAERIARWRDNKRAEDRKTKKTKAVRLRTRSGGRKRL